MTDGSRRVRPSVVAIAITSLAFAACGRAEVDPRLVGTWQLQWAGAPMYWSIRENGTYEISGPGAGLGESGTFAAAAGRWSLRSPIRGEDGGTYELPNDDLFVGTGKLGPGTWARVRPGGGRHAADAATPAVARLAGRRPCVVVRCHAARARVAERRDSGLARVSIRRCAESGRAWPAAADRVRVADHRHGHAS